MHIHMHTKFSLKQLSIGYLGFSPRKKYWKILPHKPKFSESKILAYSVSTRKALHLCGRKCPISELL